MRQRKQKRSETENGGPDSDEHRFVSFLPCVGHEDYDGHDHEVKAARDGPRPGARQVEPPLEGGDTDQDQPADGGTLGHGKGADKNHEHIRIIQLLFEKESV